jgi:hypothetical protein
MEDASSIRYEFPHASLMRDQSVRAVSSVSPLAQQIVNGQVLHPLIE